MYGGEDCGDRSDRLDDNGAATCLLDGSMSLGYVIDAVGSDQMYTDLFVTSHQAPQPTPF